MANPLASLFGEVAPFRGLQEHMRVVHTCAALVIPLFDQLVANDQVGVEHTAREIFKLEGEADKVKQELRSRLPRSLFLPVDRRDLLEVLHAQDSIADTAQDIAGLLIERPMEVTPEMRQPLLELVKACVGVVERCRGVIEQLDELLEVGFRGKEVSRVEIMLDELGRAEDATDELGTALTRVLFLHEAEMSPVSVVMWYQMIQWIGDLADFAEKVGNRLRLVIAR